MFRFTRACLTSGNAAYELLGVRKDFDLEQIQKHWRKRAKTEHPDMFPGLDEDGKRAQADKFADLQVAWKWLQEHHQAEGHTEVKVLQQVKQAARFKATTTSHAQDKRPTVPDMKDLRAGPAKNSRAAEQAREWIEKKKNESGRGAVRNSEAYDKEMSSYSRAKQARPQEVKPKMKMPTRPRR